MKLREGGQDESLVRACDEDHKYNHGHQDEERGSRIEVESIRSEDVVQSERQMNMYNFERALSYLDPSQEMCWMGEVVQEYERAVIFRLGRLLDGGSKGPGIFFVLPCIESYQKVDLRTITLDVPPQEVLTRDSVTVSVDAVVYYRVSNATVSVANVENAHHSTRLLAQTTLRNILGTKNLHEILSDRESISASMQSALDEATEPWGIKVERVEIKDVRLPVQLQRAMAAEAEAAREARAKVIAAEGEQKASRALRDAADVITTSPSAIQLRYLQVWKAMLMSDREQLGLELTINNSIRFILDEDPKFNIGREELNHYFPDSIGSHIQPDEAKLSHED
ncbi:hypothetical protein TCAL_04027 [Tigriopus californicus]|uniref:Band 7 domain-containing protein n=1 Tax=Tigriopus californicus TaxID=6832 RepID=A0A553NFZ5_TIGCA|nr:hypothetical protein TCAL_04027 [Tigriopus californicus]